MRQVEGRYKVKDATMRELHAEVKKALPAFESWSIRHVRREQNADADRLVNEALDGGTGSAERGRSIPASTSATSTSRSPTSTARSSSTAACSASS